MGNQITDTKINALGQVIHEVSDSLAFTILEVGALPLEGSSEPFHRLLDVFPGSRVIAFEIDAALCEELNKKARHGLRFHPVALGRTEESRAFYETVHPMCCSLYQPNEELLELYNNLGVAMLQSTTSVDTVSLDYFASNNDIVSIDFIKIDIQGAELDVFRGGIKALQDVVFIVSEVEFVPFYKKQPLFGDVCRFLDEQGFMFHKFLGMAGRSLKPVVLNNNSSFPSQHMWTDAVFMRNILDLSGLDPDKLLKLGILSYLYGSPDVAFFCFTLFDRQNQTNICERL